MTDGAVLSWLLDSDPSLRWEVQRDLAHEPEDVWQATRARVATEEFGAQLLSHQDEDGRWAGGAYFPADATREEQGQPWTATTWSLACGDGLVDPPTRRWRPPGPQPSTRAGPGPAGDRPGPRAAPAAVSAALGTPRGPAHAYTPETTNQHGAAGHHAQQQPEHGRQRRSKR